MTRDVTAWDRSFRHALLLATAVFAALDYWLGAQYGWPRSGFVICVAGCVGYFTNYLAIKMLFQPKRGRVFGWRGLVPKNQPQIARSLGESVQEQLLSPDILLAYISEKRLIDVGTQGLADWVDINLQKPEVRREIAALLVRLLNERGPELLTATFDLGEEAAKGLARNPQAIEAYWQRVRAALSAFSEDPDNRERVARTIRQLLRQRPPPGAGREPGHQAGIEMRGKIQLVAPLRAEAPNAAGGLLPVLPQTQLIGNRGRLRHRAGGPMAPGGLQQPDLLAVGNQEAVVVAKLAIPVTGRPALAIALQQLGDHQQRCLGAVGPLQRQAQQVHAQQCRRAAGQLRENRLVADCHAMLVDAHLRAPAPHRLGQDAGVTVGLLLDFQIGGAQQRRGIIAYRSYAHHCLRLGRLAVRILGQPDAVGRDQGLGVTHAAQFSTEPAAGPATAFLLR